MHNEQMSKLPCQFVPNFVSYVSAKYYFELVYSWKSYHNNKKGEFFIDTQCTCNERTTHPFGDASCSIDNLVIMLFQQTLNEVFIRLIIIEATANESSQVSGVCESIRIPDGIDD